MRRSILLAAATCIAATVAQAQEQATADFVDTQGEVVGSAALTAGGGGILIEVEVNGLPAGQWVSFHIHETGECNPDDAFETAGDHFNPDGSEHGYYSGAGPHAGDMPNQHVGEDGVLRAHVFNAMVTLGSGEADAMGRALMIHDGQDDYASQPSGDAGDRIACAVIQ